MTGLPDKHRGYTSPHPRSTLGVGTFAVLFTRQGSRQLCKKLLGGKSPPSHMCTEPNVLFNSTNSNLLVPILLTLCLRPDQVLPTAML